MVREVRERGVSEARILKRGEFALLMSQWGGEERFSDTSSCDLTAQLGRNFGAREAAENARSIVESERDVEFRWVGVLG